MQITIYCIGPVCMTVYTGYCCSEKPLTDGLLLAYIGLYIAQLRSESDALNPIKICVVIAAAVCRHYGCDR